MAENLPTFILTLRAPFPGHMVLFSCRQTLRFNYGRPLTSEPGNFHAVKHNLHPQWGGLPYSGIIVPIYPPVPCSLPDNRLFHHQR
jgi:hypothetical protein